MDILKYKEFAGSAVHDMASGACRGKLLFIGDLVTYQAATPSALQSMFEAAVDDYLHTCASLGKVPQQPHAGPHAC